MRKESKMKMEEALTKASHNISFACHDLREALHKAGNVESIVILALIKRTNELRREVDELLCAHISDTAVSNTANKKEEK
jgi:hypothetical protein